MTKETKVLSALAAVSFVILGSLAVLLNYRLLKYAK